MDTSTDTTTIDTLILEETRLLANIEVQNAARIDLESSIEDARVRIQKLTKDLKEAKANATHARTELDELTMREASMLAQIDVIQSTIAKVEAEINQLSEPMNALQAQLEEARMTFNEAKQELQRTVEHRDAILRGLDDIKRDYRSTIAQETRLQAEIEMTLGMIEETKERTAEIKERISPMEEMLQVETTFATEAQEELRSVRFTEAHLLAQQETIHTVPPSTKVPRASFVPESTQRVPTLAASKEDAPPPKSSEMDEEADQTDQIYELADAGYSVAEISQATQILQGRIELLLKLRGFKQP